MDLLSEGMMIRRNIGNVARPPQKFLHIGGPDDGEMLLVVPDAQWTESSHPRRSGDTMGRYIRCEFKHVISPLTLTVFVYTGISPDEALARLALAYSAVAKHLRRTLKQADATTLSTLSLPNAENPQ